MNDESGCPTCGSDQDANLICEGCGASVCIDCETKLGEDGEVFCLFCFPGEDQ